MFQFDFDLEDPEKECPNCFVLMDWKYRQCQFHCVQCDENFELKTYAEREDFPSLEQDYLYVN